MFVTAQASIGVVEKLPCVVLLLCFSVPAFSSIRCVVVCWVLRCALGWGFGLDLPAKVQVWVWLPQWLEGSGLRKGQKEGLPSYKS